MKPAAALLMLLGACADPAPEDETPVAPAAAPLPPAPPPPKKPRGEFSYTVLPDWTKEEPSNSLRKAQFRLSDKAKQAPDAELAVFYFGPNSSLISANIERWSAQMGGAEAKPESIEGVDPLLKITFVDLQGTYTGDPGAGELEKARMLAAVIETEEGPYYFKLIGPASTVGGWREEFIALLKSAHR